MKTALFVLALLGVIVLGYAGLSFRPAPRRTTALSTTLPGSETSGAALKPLSGVVVVIDPGHGGADPGAVQGDVTEAALTYRTAAELAAVLRSNGAQVVYTVRSRALTPDLAQDPDLEAPRDAVLTLTGHPIRGRYHNSPVELWERAELAASVWRKWSAHDPHAARDVFFLSLHYDDINVTTVYGATICFDGRAGQVPELARTLSDNVGGYEWLGPLSFQGVRGLSRRELGVLNPKFNPIPEKILFELATLSNTDDIDHAGHAEWRRTMVGLIARSIEDCHENHPLSR